MQAIDPIYTVNMTDHQRSWFYAEYQHASRDEVIGVLLAIFLGLSKRSRRLQPEAPALSITNSYSKQAR